MPAPEKPKKTWWGSDPFEEDIYHFKLELMDLGTCFRYPTTVRKWRSDVCGEYRYMGDHDDG